MKNKIIFTFIALSLVLYFCACDDNFDKKIKEESIITKIPDTDDYIIPGNNGIIILLNVQERSIRISWENAIIVDENSSGLFYEAFISTTNNLSSLATIRQNATMFASGSSLNLAKAEGLEPETIYYLNIIVTLQSRNMEIIYNPVSVMTEEEEAPGSIYMFASNTVQGNFGGRYGADQLCFTTKENDYPTLPGRNTSAFISIDSSDYLAQMISNYSIPYDYEILGPTDIKIANNWSDMFDGTIINSLYKSDVIIGEEITGWWSGSNSDGTYNTSVENCSGWTSTEGSGIAGSPDSDQDDWINLNSPNCSASRHLLCVTW